MARRVSSARIKANRSYTFEEAADTLGVSIATLRRWVRIEHLPCLTGQRPYLIMGAALKDFLKRRQHPCGRKLSEREFYCLTCKLPREPAGGMVDFIPIIDRRGRLQAICSECDGVLNRFVSAKDLDEIARTFDLQISNERQD